MPRIDHELKTWPNPFHAVWQGVKTFEVRRDDRGFKVGDRLLLREYEPQGASEGTYTGREITADVTYLLKGPNFGLPANMVVMSIFVERRTGGW